MYNYSILDSCTLGSDMNSFNPPPPPPLDDDDDNNAVTVVARTAVQQDSNQPKGWKPTAAEPLSVYRCTMTKRDGTQCQKWGVRGTIPALCTKHGAQLPSVRKAAEERVAIARVLMQSETVYAFDVLQQLMQPGVAEGIRLKAATEILDRAGLKAGMEVAVTVEHTGSPLADILNQLEIIAGHAEPVLEAEEIFDA